MSTTTNTTNVTVNNTLLDCIISNHGFASSRINAEQVSTDTLKDWHNTLDALLVSAYKVGSDAHNNNSADLSTIYADLSKVWGYFPTLPNGAKLKSDSDSAITMVTFATCEKNKYSADYTYKQSQIRLEKALLKERTIEDGITPKNGMEDSVSHILETIENYTNELEDLKKVAYSISKQTTRVSKSAFYKKVEDYIAEKALGLLAKTNEEIEAEEKARKDARNKKANERKAQKKETINKVA